MRSTYPRSRLRTARLAASAGSSRSSLRVWRLNSSAASVVSNRRALFFPLLGQGGGGGEAQLAAERGEGEQQEHVGLGEVEVVVVDVAHHGVAEPESGQGELQRQEERLDLWVVEAVAVGQDVLDHVLVGDPPPEVVMQHDVLVVLA